MPTGFLRTECVLGHYIKRIFVAMMQKVIYLKESTYHRMFVGAHEMENIFMEVHVR